MSRDDVTGIAAEEAKGSKCKRSKVSAEEALPSISGGGAPKYQ